VDSSELVWRKSSYSGATGTNDACVEVAFAGPAVAVRDSKKPGAGVLVVPAPAFASLVQVLPR
jgi:hypothetical protein